MGSNSEPELRWMSWEEYKAERINRLFQRQGVLKKRGRITAETVRHGEKAAESISQKGQNGQN